MSSILQIPINPNLKISSVKPPEIEKKSSKIIESIPISLYLMDVYGKHKKELIEKKIEPHYEDLRKRFQNSFDKKQPNFFIRIPYYKVLLGDQITNFFDDKIITTLDKDMIICGKETDENVISIELLDEYYPPVKIELEKLKLEIEENNYFENTENLNAEFIKYVYYAFKYAKDLIKPKKNKGLNLLISFNNVNCNVKTIFNEKAKFLNLFTGIYLATFKIFDHLNHISKKNLFEVLWNDINKLNNFSNEYVYLYAIFYLELNSIGIFFDKQFIQFKVSENISILYCDSLTPMPPIMYSHVNYWNKRKLELKLAIAIIIKKLNSK